MHRDCDRVPSSGVGAMMLGGLGRRVRRSRGSFFHADPQLFAAYVLPLLPPPAWNQSWDPPEARAATSLYFLPKSIEILFRQLLILALVIALAARGHGLRRFCALAFGGVHVLLALGGTPTGHVVRFMATATVWSSRS